MQDDREADCPSLVTEHVLLLRVSIRVDHGDDPHDTEEANDGILDGPVVVDRGGELEGRESTEERAEGDPVSVEAVEGEKL